MRYPAAIFLASACFAQQYDAGADIGYGFYRNGSIYSDAGTASAGIRNRFAAGIVLGDELSKYTSVEFHYLYHDGHPFLEKAGPKPIYRASRMRSDPFIFRVAEDVSAQDEFPPGRTAETGRIE